MAEWGEQNDISIEVIARMDEEDIGLKDLHRLTQNDIKELTGNFDDTSRENIAISTAIRSWNEFQGQLI